MAIESFKCPDTECARDALAETLAKIKPWAGVVAHA
jgi:hypothetical protein